MPKISDARREERRRQILDAAWRCFQRDGLHVTTMQDIIGTCGLSAGAVYAYFKSKEELILAAVGTSLSGLRILLAPAFAQAPSSPPEAFVAAVAMAIDGFSRREGFDLRRIALLGWAEAQRNERLREMMQLHYGAFRDELRRLAAAWRAGGTLRADADPDAVAETLLSLILGHVVHAAVLGGEGPEALARGLSGLRGG